MSMINGFMKIWPYIRPYRGMMAASFVLALLVGVLWGANLSLVFPVSNVLMEGSLQDYVKAKIDIANEEIEAAEAEIALIDAELAAEGMKETHRVRRLDARAEHLSKVALASRSLYWLKWTSARVLPWIPEDQFNTVALFFGVLFIATAIKGLLVFAQNMVVGSLVELVTIDVRKACFRKCLKLDFQTLSLEGTPSLMSRFTYDIQEMSAGLALLGGKMAREPFKAISCIALAFMVNWRLTLLSMIFVPITGYIFYRFGKLLKQASFKMMECMSRIYQVLEETFNSVRVVIAFGNTQRHRANFHRENKHYYEKAMRIRFIDSLTNPTVELMGISAIFVTVLPCMYLLLRKTTTIWGIQLANSPPDISTLILLYTFLVGTIDPVRKLSSIYTKLKRSVTAIERIDEFLHTETRVLESENPRLLPRHRKSIQFENIRFAYATKENRPRPEALQDVSLNVEFGECVIVVGENGSGKSTLVNLLPRYYDPDSGRILIDGVDIQQVPTKVLRSQLGVVTQETQLFNGTIYDNIRYGNPSATRQQIEDAAVQAGVTQFIDQLPDGFETHMGEKGAGLSGGQRQRIALARALVRQPAILILDEATSAIDSQSEFHIQQALQRYRNQCTTFIITHAVNSSLLDLCSRIVVMHEGVLIAEGQHEQLIETCPLYLNLFQAQVKQRAA